MHSPTAVAVVCAPGGATALAASVGLELAARRKAACVLVAVWADQEDGGPGWLAPALPAARRLAVNLVARGHDVAAAGRLAVVRLPADEPAAAAAAERALAAAGVAPTVLAVAGPRGAPFDALLATQDLVLVATGAEAEPGLARLAVSALEPRVRAVRPCDVPPASARAVAALGLALLPSTRRVLGPSLEPLG